MHEVAIGARRPRFNAAVVLRFGSARPVRVLWAPSAGGAGRHMDVQPVQAKDVVRPGLVNSLCAGHAGRKERDGLTRKNGRVVQTKLFFDRNLPREASAGKLFEKWRPAEVGALGRFQTKESGGDTWQER